VVGHLLESWTVHSDAQSPSSLCVAWDFKRRFGWMGSVLEITILQHDWQSTVSYHAKARYPPDRGRCVCGFMRFGEADRQAPAQAELRPTAPGLPASTCHLFQRLWGIPWVSRVNPWQIRERVDRQVLPLLNNLPLYRNGLRQGSIKDGPRRTGEHEVAFLDAGRQELGGITLGHPYACTQVLQRFQFAIAEAAEAVTGAG